MKGSRKISPKWVTVWVGQTTFKGGKRFKVSTCTGIPSSKDRLVGLNLLHLGGQETLRLQRIAQKKKRVKPSPSAVKRNKLGGDYLVRN